MKLRSNWRFFLLGAGALAVAGCGTVGARSQAAGPRKGVAVPVSVAVARQRDVPIEIQVIGNVEAYSTISVKSQITGPLAAVHFREGDVVKKGALLFTIDPSPFQAAVDEAEGNLAKNEALLSQAEATLRRDAAQARYSQVQATRYTELFRKGVVSRDQSEQMQSGAEALNEGLRADEASIKSAQAAIVATRATLANTKILLGYTQIRSPIDGRTGNLSVKAGNLVAANTVELIAINEVQPIYVTFAVPEVNLGAIKQHMAAGKLAVFATSQEATGGQPEAGVLTFVDNNVDPTTGTIKLKGTFSNAGRALWPGEYVRVTLRLATQANAIVVPQQAVQSGQEGAFVYVVKPDQAVESRPVTTGPRVDQDMVIASGLRTGEVVVTEGQLRLAPGMHVRVKDNNQPGPPRGRRRG
jgi:membrane fusion protein, multidrug efflux system